MMVSNRNSLFQGSNFQVNNVEVQGCSVFTRFPLSDFFLILQAELLRCMDVLAENFGKESLNFLLQKARARTSHVC